MKPPGFDMYIPAPRLLPRWITDVPPGDAQAAEFAAGAAVAVLDSVVRAPQGTVPAALVGERLALAAAEACLKLEGRRTSVGDIRDAVCLTRAGDAPGPAGEMFVAWRRCARMSVRGTEWRAQVAAALPADVAVVAGDILTTCHGTPVAQAASALSGVLRIYPRHEAAALMLADIVLARAVGWARPVPLLAGAVSAADLRAVAQGADDAALRMAKAVTAGCDATLRVAADLTRRCAHLAAVAPKLRSKAAAPALEVFLRHDVVSPSGMLSPVIAGSRVAMTDRAARRLCDRLVDLGAVREMTGRTTFRLYGV